MRIAAPLLMSLMLSLSLAGCGFEPLYAQRGAGDMLYDMAGVEVAPIPDRLGQIMHNKLTSGLNPNAKSASNTHRLEIALEDSIEGFGYRADEAITRERVRLVAHYRLIDLETGKVVVEENARADNSIDVLQSDFSTYTAEQTAFERNAAQVSQAILARLALYFRARQGTADAR